MSFRCLEKLVIFVFLVALGCASDEERFKKVQEFSGTPLDLNLVHYEDLETGVAVNLAQYMRANQLKHLLLVFGSVQCSGCNEKALQLSRLYLPNHRLFVAPEHADFDLIGINVDIATARRQFDRIWYDDALRLERGYDFVRWHDQDKSLETYFLGRGDKLAIPFMALISAEGIVKRYQADEHWQMDAVLADVLQLVSGQSGTLPEPPVIKPPVPYTPPGIQRWQIPIADRFADLPIRNCAADTEALKPEEVLATGNYRIVQLFDGDCDAVCRANKKMIASAVDRCPVAQGCQELSLEVLAKGEGCLSEASHGIAKDVWQTFSTVLNWDADHYPPLQNEWGLPESLPPLQGPMVLGFLPTGQLKFAVDGVLREKEISALFSPAKPATGANFSIYAARNASEAPRATSFREVASAATYTVLSMYSLGCAACEETLEQWSDASNEASPLHVCRESPEFCQVQVLEKMPPDAMMTSPAGMHALVAERLYPLGVRLPIMISTELLYEDFSRFYEGYLEVLFPELFGQSAAIIYDREGKIVARFIGSDQTNGVHLSSYLRLLRGVVEAPQS